MIGTGKTQKCEELEGFRDFSILQASTQEEAVEIADSMCFDGHSDSKGKDRHGTDGSLSLRFGKASGRVDVLSVSACCSALRRSAGLRSLSWLLRRESDFVKGVDGSTRVHRVKGQTVVGELLDCTVDVWVTCNGKMVDFGDTMAGIGIGNNDTLRCCGRLRGGAQRYRQPPTDTLGQWTCLACGQERVWLVKKRCFRCECPKGHEAPQPDPYIVGPMGRSCGRSLPTASDLNTFTNTFLTDMRMKFVTTIT